MTLPALAVVIVAGPTASGKSALALAVAEAFGGTVINADSMQVYRDLRVLTARPGPAEEARMPHRLYGVLDAADPCSAAPGSIFARYSRGSRRSRRFRRRSGRRRGGCTPCSAAAAFAPLLPPAIRAARLAWPKATRNAW